MTQRYRIMSDGDHDYFVPVDQESDFEAWVESFNENVGYEGPEFAYNRIDGRFTFTDPKNG